MITRSKNTTRRPWPPKKADLEALIEEAIVDTYGESEQRTGFYTMIEEHLGVPFEAEIGCGLPAYWPLSHRLRYPASRRM